MTDDTKPTEEPPQTVPDGRLEKDSVQVAVRLTRGDFGRLVAHRARMREATPAQFVGLATALREVIHRGLDAVEPAAAAAEEASDDEG